MTDTKLISREPTDQSIDAALKAWLDPNRDDAYYARIRRALIAAFDAAPDLAPAPAPAPSEPTLRQRYAMAAMQGRAAGWLYPDPEAVRSCFAWADAMLEAEGER